MKTKKHMNKLVHEEVCSNCGIPIVKNRPWQKYCDSTCRIEAHWKRRLK